MGKNKKIILIISIIVIAATLVTTFLLLNKNEEQEVEQSNIQEDDGTSKLIALKEKIDKNKNYSVSMVLNDENKKITTRKDDEAKVEIYDEGELKTYLVKENVTYLLIDNTKKYYEYKNNSSLLNDFINNIDELLALNYEVGTEKISDNTYKYEEFKGTSSFIINYKGNIDNESSKTRFYFDGNDLKYIKTYVGDVQQLLKIEIQLNNSNKNDFNIPEEYTK